jgi:hypothetical protein
VQLGTSVAVVRRGDPVARTGELEASARDLLGTASRWTLVRRWIASETPPSSGCLPSAASGSLIEAAELATKGPGRLLVGRAVVWQVVPGGVELEAAVLPLSSALLGAPAELHDGPVRGPMGRVASRMRCTHIFRT